MHVCHAGVRDLAGRLIVAGRAPCDAPTLAEHVRALRPRAGMSVIERILEPGAHPLATLAASQVLLQPIENEGEIVGVLLAGGKGGDDPALSSFETQLVEATAGFVGVFHRNLSRFAELTQTFDGTLRALTAAIDAKDRYTRGHSERVSLLASQMGAALGLDAKTIEVFRVAGLVHDVGKIGVPEAILCKPSRLSDDEFAYIMRHSAIGNDILSGIPALAPMLPGVLHHHERWDGRGYPHKLAGEQIPLVARVLALCDTFDAMSSSRAYRPALPRTKVLHEILDNGGTQFDPALAPVFVRLDFAPFDAALERHKHLAQSTAAAA
jgi:HD-GYP domain-containing protein (c-di-GMP phosphodiesterase class II)